MRDRDHLVTLELDNGDQHVGTYVGAQDGFVYLRDASGEALRFEQHRIAFWVGGARHE